MKNNPNVKTLSILTNAAFQIWMDQREKQKKASEHTGIRKFREQVREENCNFQR